MFSFKKEAEMNNMRNILSYRKTLCTILVVFVIAVAAATVPAKNKKYGIFVGINDYPGIKSDLTGAVNDAQSLRTVLISRFRFLPSNTALLLDRQATREGVIGKIKAFGSLAGDGDVLVFHYSGHGSLFPDKYSEELDEKQKLEVDADLGEGERYVIPLDYYDSAIVPFDSAEASSGKRWGNLILDDELYGLFAEITKKGATVVFISDSCHSGTIGKAESSKVRFMSPEQALNVESLADLKPTIPDNQVRVETRDMHGSYIALSAAKDNEFAMDSNTGKTLNGLFTANLIAVMKTAPATMTYKRLMDLVRVKVADVSTRVFSNAQNPQLDVRFGSVDAPIFRPIVKSKQT
jgi:metacaspase-1